MKSITHLKSLECFYDFLYWYYEEEVAKGLSEDSRDGLIRLLSCMNIGDDGYPLDMAYWEYWLESIHKSSQILDSEFITYDQAVEVAIIFLDDFFKRGNCSDEEIKVLIDKLITLKNNDKNCEDLRVLWLDAFEEEID